MWTVHIRWKIFFEIFVCSWAGHDWDQYLQVHIWNTSDYFCQRCRRRRPSTRRFREEVGAGVRMGVEYLDLDGGVIDRTITGSNVPGDLGRS